MYLNNKAPKYANQIMTHLRGEISSLTTIGGNFNTQLSVMNRTTRQKVNKEIKD